MSKRPPIDLAALTAEVATPMAEAIQRTQPREQTDNRGVKRELQFVEPVNETVRTENLEGLSFKVPPEFRRRFRQRAATADLKLNELLFEAFEAWEKKNGLTS